MAETGLSYEGDIAPLKQQYFQQVFSDPRLGPRAAAALSSQFSASLDKSLAQRQELQDRSAISRSRELQFETAKFTLEREREKAARETSNLTTLAPLLATFDAIRSDPTTDSKTKSSLIGQTAIQQSLLLSQEPAARIAYDAAIRSIAPEDRPEINYTLGSYILQGGDPKFLPAGLADKPDSVLSPLTYFGAKQQTAMAAGKAEANYRSSIAQTKREQEQIDKAITAIGSAVTKPKYDTAARKITGVEFEAPAVKGSFDYLINRFGTPEEKAKAKSGDASVLVGITNSIIPRVLSGETAASGPTEGQKIRASWTTAPK